jgi:hypothetical protein
MKVTVESLIKQLQCLNPKTELDVAYDDTFFKSFRTKKADNDFQTSKADKRYLTVDLILKDGWVLVNPTAHIYNKGLFYLKDLTPDIEEGNEKYWNLDTPHGNTNFIRLKLWELRHWAFDFETNFAYTKY